MTQTTHATVRRIVVAHDGSPTSVAAVRIAAEEADRTGLPLVAVLVVPLVVGLTGAVSSPDDAALRDADAVLHESLAGLREDHPGLPVSAEVVQGGGGQRAPRACRPRPSGRRRLP